MGLGRWGRSAAVLMDPDRPAQAQTLPDPVKATAGIHFMNVLNQLGIDVELGDRLRPYSNGAAAMQALSKRPAPVLRTE